MTQFGGMAKLSSDESRLNRGGELAMKSLCLVVAGVMILSGGFLHAAERAVARLPNVIVLLADDLSERHDLAKQQPERAKAMAARLKEIYRSSGDRRAAT
jgi:hypothetical protein